MLNLLLGDCRERLASIEPNSIDAIVTDPPYELGFMGKTWDSSGIAYDATVWSESFRVLKPGGHILAFGGTRTFHRLTTAIEDAGFEIRDCLSWLYGTGFPKSLNLPGGLGTALKPAWEPITMARKPLIGTVVKNVTEFGTGALNIDGCRITSTDTQLAEKYASVKNAGPRENSIFSADTRPRSEQRIEPHSAGRWPANVLLDEGAAFVLDEQSGGGASRFFYVAKPAKKERNLGCEGLEAKSAGEVTEREDGSDGLNSPRAGSGRTSGNKNFHPTVKPIELMQWLVRLVTPINGVVLDPFLGSGTTGIAALRENRRFIGIEMSAEYMEIAKARIAAA